jgi:small conductance mechanosensitive channel
VLEKPEIWGIESVSAEAIVIRLVMKARPAEQWAVARELRLRLKLALDEINVNLPALNRVVIDNRGTAPKVDPVPAQTKPLPTAEGEDRK